MDKYVTICKNNVNINFIGNQEVVEIVQKIIDTNETICLYGDSGVGKTFLVNHLMHGTNWVELNYETIKGRDDFMQRLKISDCHVVIDDLESDVHLMKDIFDIIRSGNKISNGCLIFIARNLNKINFCNSVYFEAMDVPTLVTIAKRQFPGESLMHLESLSKKSNGNIRNLLFSIQFDSKRDIFKTPKDFIYGLLCDSDDDDPRDYLCCAISEHGYIWDIVHENYIDAENIDLPFIAECMSYSDILDNIIYNGCWDIIPFFSTISTIIPAIKINHTLKKATMRSGSAWTKFGNYKMRNIKYKSMSNRNVHKLDVDAMMVLRTYCQKDKIKTIELFKTYGLNGSDVDVINHLAVINKLKTKEIQLLKKSLKELQIV